MFSIIEKINESLREEIANEPKRNYVGASAIGHACCRKIWYEFNGYEGERISEKLKLTFDIGKIIEKKILNYFDLYLDNPNIVDYNNTEFQDKTIKKFKGNCDAIIRIITIEPDIKGSFSKLIILEIKTANNASFNKFKKDGLKTWNEQYYAQVQSYMGMSDIHESILLVINKDTSEMCEEWVEYDPIYYGVLRQKAKDIIEAKEPPPRINESPLFYICSMCKFKKICHN